MINYRVFGPFKVPRKGDLFDNGAAAKSVFWQEVEQSEAGLSKAYGCYILSVCQTVWYVGKAQKLTFGQECFGSTKELKISKAINEGGGDAYLHLVARTMSGGTFAGRGHHEDIDELESRLIEIASRCNRHLLNKSKTKFCRNVVVPGVFNSKSGHRNKRSVKTLMKVLGIRAVESQADGVTLKGLIDEQLLSPPVTLVHCLRTGQSLCAEVCMDGSIRFQGRSFPTPGAAAVAALANKERAVTGWGFWTLKQEDGTFVPLATLKKEYLKRKG